MDHLVWRKSQEWQWNFLERKLAGVFRFILLVIRKPSTLDCNVLRHNSIPERILDSAWRSAPASAFLCRMDHFVGRKSQELQRKFLERKLAALFRFISLVRKSSTLDRIVLRHNSIPELLVSSHTGFILLEVSKRRFVRRKSQELQMGFSRTKIGGRWWFHFTSSKV
jgi:hypothetical protein